jgi:hypothetical protein
MNSTCSQDLDTWNVCMELQFGTGFRHPKALGLFTMHTGLSGCNLAAAAGAVSDSLAQQLQTLAASGGNMKSSGQHPAVSSKPAPTCGDLHLGTGLCTGCPAVATLPTTGRKRYPLGGQLGRTACPTLHVMQASAPRGECWARQESVRLLAALVKCAQDSIPANAHDEVPQIALFQSLQAALVCAKQSLQRNVEFYPNGWQQHSSCNRKGAYGSCALAL